jgi:hypothetical protein
MARLSGMGDSIWDAVKGLVVNHRQLLITRRLIDVLLMFETGCIWLLQLQFVCLRAGLYKTCVLCKVYEILLSDACLQENVSNLLRSNVKVRLPAAIGLRKAN